MQMRPRSDESKELFITRFRNSEEGIDLGIAKATKAAAAVWNYYNTKKEQESSRIVAKEKRDIIPHMNESDRFSAALHGNIVLLNTIAQRFENVEAYEYTDVITEAIVKIQQMQRGE